MGELSVHISQRCLMLLAIAGTGLAGPYVTAQAGEIERFVGNVTFWA